MKVHPVVRVEKDALAALCTVPFKANVPDLETQVLLLREGKIVALPFLSEMPVYEDENICFKLRLYDPVAIPEDAVMAYFSRFYGFIQLYVPEDWDLEEVEEQWKMWADYFGIGEEVMLDAEHKKFLYPLKTPVTETLKAGEKYVVAPVFIDETRGDAPAVLVDVLDKDYNFVTRPLFILDPQIHRSVTLKLSFFKLDEVAYYAIAL